MNVSTRLLQEEEGQGMVEYVLIFSMIVIMVISVMGIMGTSLANYYTTVTNKINI